MSSAAEGSVSNAPSQTLALIEMVQRRLQISHIVPGSVIQQRYLHFQLMDVYVDLLHSSAICIIALVILFNSSFEAM